jgi:aromatic ring-cleaving dioxygenase
MSGSPEALHGYHAHVYYNDDTRLVAEKLRDTLASDFPVQIGKNAGIAGPHSVPQIQIVFRNEAFQRAVADVEP